MVIDDIRAQLRAIPAVSGWPQMVQLIGRPTDPKALPCWEYPLVACQAVGGTAEQALPAATAVFCLLYSIHLVDDMLDRDPTGLYHDLGEGTVANLALAFQAASALAIEGADVPLGDRVALHACVSQTALATAFGQDLDLDQGEGQAEAAYWNAVEHKTPPLFCAALFMGAVLGGASREVAGSLRELGFVLGKSVQVSDDLTDALDKPTNPDWHRRWNNLPILYAMTADHPQLSRFQELLADIDRPEALSAAQEILVRSGAVSFATYHMIELQREARALLASMPLHDSSPLEELLNHHVKPLRSLFEAVGAELPEESLE